MVTIPSGNTKRSLFPLYAVRVYEHGRQLVFPFYSILTHALGLHAGDLLLVRVHLPYVTFCLTTPAQAVAVEKFGKDELPPSYKDVLLELAKVVR